MVRIVEQPTDAVLDRLYRNATLVVNMSRYEGFGLTVLEALAYGCPTIASDIPAHRELVDSAARLVAPDDVAALAAAIEKIIEDPTTYDDMFIAGRQRAENFTVDAMIRGHLEAYMQVAPTPTAAVLHEAREER